MHTDFPSPRQVPRQGDHRRAALYHMRVRHLQLLASLLEEAGHRAAVTEPYGMPLLHVGPADGTRFRIVATIGYGEVDWYRWAGGDYLAPCGEPGVAAETVDLTLRACRKVRS